jgi:DNA-binding SARP family transcriptional activator
VVLDGEYPDNPNDPTGSGHYLGAEAPLPGSMLSFTPTGGSAVTAVLSDSGDTTGKGSADDGLFDATYSFVVPATLTTGTIAVAAGPFTGAEFTLYTAEQGTSTLNVTTPTSLGVTFPAVPAAAVQKTPPWVGQPVPQTAASSSSPASGGSSHGVSHGGFPIWLAVLLLLAVAAGAVLVQRALRNRGATAAPGPRPVTQATADPTTSKSTVTEPIVSSTPVPEPPAPVVDATPVKGADLMVEELLCFLVLHAEHPLNADQLQLALWPPEGARPEINRKSFHSYLSYLRQCVGADHLPEATGAAGYRILGADSHSALFGRLNAEADRSDGPRAIELRTEALTLVRGVPFAGVARGQYEWAFSEDLHIHMAQAVVACALRLGNDLFALGDYAGVDAAMAAGLRADKDDPHLKSLRQMAVDVRNEGLVRPSREIWDTERAQPPGEDEPPDEDEPS